MRKLILCLLLCTMVQAADAQRVSRSYKDKPMSKVLVDLRRTDAKVREHYMGADADAALAAGAAFWNGQKKMTASSSRMTITAS